MLYGILQAWVSGLLDALKFHNCLFYLMTSNTIRYRTIQCFVLNGVIFVGNLLLAEYVIRPLIRALLGGDDSVTETVLFLLYQVLWLYPFYFLSFALNGMWYQDIADHAFILMNGQKRSRTFSFGAWVNSMAEEVYRYLLVGVCLIQGFAIGFIPYIGKWLCLVHFAWLYALYSFEYKWSFLGWSLSKRLNYFQYHWVYFFGFGTPLALITILFPKFLGSGIYALCFPCFLVMSIVANPVDHRGSAAKLDANGNSNSGNGSNNPSAAAMKQNRGLPIFTLPDRKSVV